MLIRLLVSLFGIAVVYRNLSPVEKLEVLPSSKLRELIFFLQLPFYFHLFFKELFVIVLIYIGIFSITLSFHSKIIGYFAEKTFEKLHLNVIERLILMLKAGKSGSLAAKTIFAELNAFEKTVFSGIQRAFEFKNLSPAAGSGFRQSYFEELNAILRSPVKVTEQLKAYRAALRLRKNLRHKSRQALQQARAQAVVCLFIYAIFMFLSCTYLGLEVFSWTTFQSLALFFSGQAVIFRLGGEIRWKT